MSIDERYTIDTPENVEFSYTVAGIGSRFLAAIVDTALLALLQMMVIFVMVMFLSALGFESDASSAMRNMITALGILVGFIILWGYFIIFEMFWNGQSPGKRLVRLRVVREGGRPITFVASVIRNLVRIIDFLPSFYGLGVLVMFIDQRARRLGDLTAGTLVVKDRTPVSLDSLASHADMVPSPPTPGQPLVSTTLPNLHLITENDYDVVQQFLRRRSELGRDSRQRLGWQLAEGLRDRLNIADEGNHERFLEHLVHEYRIARQAATSELRGELRTE
jgi:uncharacterized RDD family membrane protein YckC